MRNILILGDTNSIDITLVEELRSFGYIVFTSTEYQSYNSISIKVLRERIDGIIWTYISNREIYNHVKKLVTFNIFYEYEYMFEDYNEYDLMITRRYNIHPSKSLFLKVFPRKKVLTVDDKNDVCILGGDIPKRVFETLQKDFKNVVSYRIPSDICSKKLIVFDSNKNYLSNFVMDAINSSIDLYINHNNVVGGNVSINLFRGLNELSPIKINKEDIYRKIMTSISMLFFSPKQYTKFLGLSEFEEKKLSDESIKKFFINEGVLKKHFCGEVNVPSYFNYIDYQKDRNIIGTKEFIYWNYRILSRTDKKYLSPISKHLSDKEITVLKILVDSKTNIKEILKLNTVDFLTIKKCMELYLSPGMS